MTSLSIIFICELSILGGVTGCHTPFKIVIVDGAGSKNPAFYSRSSGATLDDLLRNFLADKIQQLYHRTNIDIPYNLCLDVSFEDGIVWTLLLTTTNKLCLAFLIQWIIVICDRNIMYIIDLASITIIAVWFI